MRRKSRRAVFIPSRFPARRLPHHAAITGDPGSIAAPPATHPPFRRIDNGLIRSAPFDEVAAPPNLLRSDPLPFPDKPTDFIDGLTTIGGNGDASERNGVAIHIYGATRSM